MKKTLLMVLIACFLSTSALADGLEIIFATNATWPPMEFINADKEIVGYSIDFMKAAGKEAGFTPVFKAVAWDGIFAGLGDKYDAICSSVSITDERKKSWISPNRTSKCARPWWSHLTARPKA